LYLVMINSIILHYSRNIDTKGKNSLRGIIFRVKKIYPLLH
jgi:hypothetical protein